MNSAEKPKPAPGGTIIPSGTEQETGLTRGETEKPDRKKIIKSKRTENKS